MPVITISREYGAGGLIVGREVARRLGADFLDSRLVDEVARRMSCPAEAIRRWDERGEGLILRLLRALRSAHPEFASPSPVSQELLEADPNPERVAAMVKEVIREEARSRNAVIVGRGGAFILADRDDAIHVRLVARLEDRVRRVAERTAWNLEETAKRAEQIDRERAAYVKRHFGGEMREASNFTLILNTSAVSFDRATEIIVGLAESRRPE